jgi:ribosome-binding protein aMBF1 (putative translation factor)
MNDSAKIGKRIQTYREKLAMTVDDLSERTSLPAALIKEFEGDTMYYNSLMPHCLSAVGGDKWPRPPLKL